jgi:signal transduction histidine kinase
MHLFKPLENFWNCLIRVGVTSDITLDEAKYVRFTNVVAVLTCVAVAVYIPYSVLTGKYILSALQILDVLCVLSVLWFNHMHYHKVARHMYLAVINAFVLINACFVGHDSRVHEFFYISYVVPFLLFSVRDYRHIIGGVLIAVGAFAIYQGVYNWFTPYNMEPAIQESMFHINTVMKFVLFGFAIYILAFYNYKTESELAAANKKLEESNAQFAEINARLEESNNKLAQQAKELKRSNEDLEQFGYIISHDLKAPVRNISSFMKLLMRQFGENTPKDTRELIELSKQSSDRLARQIDDMLSYCRIERNLPPVGPVDTNQLVQMLKMELAPRIKEKNGDVFVEGELPVVGEVHSTLLYHVFQNLIANGIKFNASERPEVKIKCVEGDGLLTFEITDNGIGIDEAYQSKLFQMFKRLHTVDQFEGTGIGLAVCKKIVNFYQGDIWFKGEPGKGTTFFFTLKRPVAKLPQIKQAEQVEAVMKAA